MFSKAMFLCKIRMFICVMACTAAVCMPAMAQQADKSVARQWMDITIECIRLDYARPTIAARNLFHVSAAMWDAWAMYDQNAQMYLPLTKMSADDVEAARAQAISFAAYRVLKWRFEWSPGGLTVMPKLNALMASLGYDITDTSTSGTTPARLGNKIGKGYINFGLADGSNESGAYKNVDYAPVNLALIVAQPGNPPRIDPIWPTRPPQEVDPDRWQPLSLQSYVDQNGNTLPLGYPSFQSAEWGRVTPFALKNSDRINNYRNGKLFPVYLDQGGQPKKNSARISEYFSGFEQVLYWSSHHDPSDGVQWDISPASIGAITIPPSSEPADSFYNLFNGGDNGVGHTVNPATGNAYQSNIVPRGDYVRVLAEFWADGPKSETPPGHWVSIYNKVMDSPLFQRRLQGRGPILGALEWDVKTYLALCGGLHDAAITAWSNKGWYDASRPITAIRLMAERGQRSDPTAPSYNPDGLWLVPGLVELITEESSSAGQRHAALAASIGKVAVKTWQSSRVVNPASDVGGVGWSLALNWVPYQRPTFVSPPFGGYISGHSTFSRTAAEILTNVTGSEYFPGGLMEYVCSAGQFLVFEDGPSVDVRLQWATFRDAADQCSLSRIWGGIHPGFDDLPGRRAGIVVASRAVEMAQTLWNSAPVSCPEDLNQDGFIDSADIGMGLLGWGEAEYDLNGDGFFESGDIGLILLSFGACN